MVEKIKISKIEKILLDTPYVGYRQSMSEAEEALQDLCGLLNTEMAKGILLFGVTPGKKITGIGNVNLDSALAVLEKRMGKFHPSFFPLIEVLEIEEDDGCFLIKVSVERSREVPLYEYEGRAFIRDGAVTRQMNSGEKKHLIRQRRREFHTGPWKCDQCGTVVGEISKVILSEWGIQRSYTCPCGGEFYPKR